MIEIFLSPPGNHARTADVSMWITIGTITETPGGIYMDIMAYLGLSVLSATILCHITHMVYQTTQKNSNQSLLNSNSNDQIGT
jgi:hypothetical protein